jgi:hypothetical protein
MAIWNMLWELGKFSPVLECCTEKNLAALPLCVCENPSERMKNYRSKLFKSLRRKTCAAKK